MNAEQRAALLLLSVGLPALVAVRWGIERPLLRLPYLAVVVSLAVVFALAVGWAMQ